MKNILLLYTGGTIGCQGEPLAPMSAGDFGRQLAKLGLLPNHVVCELRALAQPLDSANMQPGDWLDIAAALLAAWADFDGFVVLHGTDTLEYTASALSLLLVGIDKPIVLTGSQYPLSAARSDAPRNLADAIAVAGTIGVREVVTCFAGHILRGNRCIKRSAQDTDAFASPNYPVLGEVTNGQVVLDAGALLPADGRPFDCGSPLAALAKLRHGFADHGVWVIHLHPGFPVDVLNAVLELAHVPSGWILACYGTGNAPEGADFLAALHAARARGVVVVAVTQTRHGVVSLGSYQAGRGLASAGVVPGRDLTLPAALAKLQLLLARGLSQDEVVAMMSESVAGEVS